jgi:hypothetical protein
MQMQEMELDHSQKMQEMRMKFQMEMAKEQAKMASAHDKEISKIANTKVKGEDDGGDDESPSVVIHYDENGNRRNA